MALSVSISRTLKLKPMFLAFVLQRNIVSIQLNIGARRPQHIVKMGSDDPILSMKIGVYHPGSTGDSLAKAQE